MEDSRVEQDHTSRRKLKLSRFKGSKIALCQPLGRKFERTSAVASGQNGKARISSLESVRVVEHLDVPPVSLTQIDRGVVEPVMVILMKLDATRARKRYSQTRVTEVVACADDCAKKSSNEGCIQKLVRPGSLFIPGFDAQTVRLPQAPLLCIRFVKEFYNGFEIEYLVYQSIPGLIRKYIGKCNVAIFVKTAHIGFPGGLYAKESRHTRPYRDPFYSPDRPRARRSRWPPGLSCLNLVDSSESIRTTETRTP